MAGKFEIKKSKNGKEYFVLKAGNGQVILQSEQYESHAACTNGIESVRKNSQSEQRFEEKQAKDGRTYFILKATNGQAIGQSQMYKSPRGMRNGIDSVRRHAADASVSDLRV
ncbi:MAG: YegP family protein [Xanthomonadales bacterium]|jgi:uncharacterized protein YegP (UPF0339 family)|nr:YegP family protein [Xanthomonadales bacterium]